MGCASSAALPFLTGRGAHTVTGSTSQNGKPPYELNGDGANGVKDINETFVSDKMKEVVDSSAVQGVIGGVIDTKDDIVNQVQGAGEAVANKLSSVVHGVETAVESTFHQVTDKLEDVEEKVRSEVKSVGEKISNVVGFPRTEDNTEREDAIDELLAAMPEDGGDLEDKTKAAAEELIEAAAEEVKADETED